MTKSKLKEVIHIIQNTIQTLTLFDKKTLQRTISCYLDPSNNVIIPSTKSINFY